MSEERTGCQEATLSLASALVVGLPLSLVAVLPLLRAALVAGSGAALAAGGGVSLSAFRLSRENLSLSEYNPSWAVVGWRNCFSSTIALREGSSF